MKSDVCVVVTRSEICRKPSLNAGSEAHLFAPNVRQILLSRAALEIDFKVHSREIGSRTPLQKGLSLLRKVRPILRAIGRRADVDHTRVFAPPVLVRPG